MFISVSLYTELTLLYQKGTNTTISFLLHWGNKNSKVKNSTYYLPDNWQMKHIVLGVVRGKTLAVRKALQAQVFCRKCSGSLRMGPTPRYRAFYKDSLAPHAHLAPPLQKTAGDHFVLQSINDVTSNPTTVAGLLILLKSYDKNKRSSDRQIT